MFLIRGFVIFVVERKKWGKGIVGIEYLLCVRYALGVFSVVLLVFGCMFKCLISIY